MPFAVLSDPGLPDNTPENTLQAVLAISLTGLALLRPVLATGGSELVDFSYSYLNPAAQRLLGQPERPAILHAATDWDSHQADTLAFFRDTFLSGRAGQHEADYQPHGRSIRLRLAAQRSGELLVLSFTEVAAHGTDALEAALRESKQHEQAAQAEADRQRQQLHSVLEEAPAMICLFEGSQHTFAFVNQPYQALVGDRPLVGKPIAEAMPELTGQPIFGLLDRVYQTGETFHASEMLVQLDHHNEGRRELEKRYYNFIYQARRTGQGEVNGIFVFAYDVTVQVMARQQVAAQEERTNHLNEELAAANEELRAANEEINASNLELLTTQAELRYLNQELEARVANRTKALTSALQQAERQRETFYRIFEQTPAAVAILRGAEHRLDYFNPAYCQLLPSNPAPGYPLSKLQAGAEAQGLEALLDHVYHTGETVVMPETAMRVARQPAQPLEDAFFTFTYQARRNLEGVIDGILVFAFEVTDQVRARQVVEKSERYLRRMADSVPTMIWLTDRDGRCIYLNQQWYDYTAQTEAEGLVLGWLTAVHPDDAPAAQTIFLDASARHAPFNILYRLRRQDGRYRWAIDTGRPRFDRAGQFDGFVGTVFDIHEQKQAEQALQRLTTNLRTARDQAQALNGELQSSNEQLRRINVDLDNFIYTASHDLKAPITNIEGLLHHLREQLPAAHPFTLATAPLLGMMQHSVERFQRTLEHLSDVTKLQKEHDQPVTQVALAAVVADVQLDLRPLLAESGATVTVALSACPAVSFSAKNLRSVVYNLLSNALKYRDPARPAQVHIGCRPEDGYLVLSVQDNGLGLDASQQAELFTMFRRFHTGIDGSGVGLYMVKKIVENAGGKLLVESAVGVGSTFSVYFRR